MPDHVSASDITNKQFTLRRLKPGYDEPEVDEFLDDVEVTLKSWQKIGGGVLSLALDVKHRPNSITKQQIAEKLENLIADMPYV